MARDQVQRTGSRDMAGDQVQRTGSQDMARDQVPLERPSPANRAAAKRARRRTLSGDGHVLSLLGGAAGTPRRPGGAPGEPEPYRPALRAVQGAAGRGTAPDRRLG